MSEFFQDIASTFAGAILGDEGASRGAARELRDQKHYHNFLYNKATAAGLTPYEFYNTGSAGTVGGASGQAQVMGNNWSKVGEGIRSAMLQRGLKQMDNDTARDVAQIHADASKNVAETQTQTQKLIAENRLKLDRDTFLYVTLPESAAKLKLNEADLKLRLNQVATSTPRFMKFMKMLTMGVDNTLSAFLQNMNGYNLTDPESVKKIPEKDRSKILSMLLAI